MPGAEPGSPLAGLVSMADSQPPAVSSETPAQPAVDVPMFQVKVTNSACFPQPMSRFEFSLPQTSVVK